jgi:hypothetical protein
MHDGFWFWFRKEGFRRGAQIEEGSRVFGGVVVWRGVQSQTAKSRGRL